MSESEASRLERLIGPIRDMEAAMADLTTLQTCLDEKVTNIKGLAYHSFKLGNSMGAEGGLLYGDTHTAVCWVRVPEVPSFTLRASTLLGRLGLAFSRGISGEGYILKGEQPQSVAAIIERWREHPERVLECRDGVAALWTRGDSNPASYADHLSRMVSLLGRS